MSKLNNAHRRALLKATAWSTPVVVTSISMASATNSNPTACPYSLQFIDNVNGIWHTNGIARPATLVVTDVSTSTPVPGASVTIEQVPTNSFSVTGGSTTGQTNTSGQFVRNFDVNSIYTGQDVTLRYVVSAPNGASCVLEITDTVTF